MSNLSSFLNEKNLISMRHELHKIPELGYKEFKTKSFILNYLTKLKIFEEKIGAKLTEILETGFFIDIQGQGKKIFEDKKIIAYRTDLDGLPIFEETNVPYSSIHKGQQHACGHDGHMIILMGFCEFYIKNLEKIPSNITVRFLFQPAEENLNGACKMIDGKCLENVEEIYGLHNITKFNLGEIGICDGPIMAKVDVFEIIIKAKGGHGSTPHLCHSPITIGANIILALNQVTSQEIDSNERCVMTIGQFTSGNTYNVIPETGNIRGTIRTLTKGTSEKIIKRIYEITKGNAEIYNSEILVKFDEPGELTWNHPDPTKFVRKAAEKYFSAKTEGLPVMASEDFAFYQKIIPGCFFMLGCRDDEHTGYLHTSVYDFNDKAIMTGVEMYIRILEEKYDIKLL